MNQSASPFPRILIVDLNNFARYPTVAVGLLTAILRDADLPVEVVSPLAFGVSSVPREPRAAAWGLVESRFRHATAMSRNRLVQRARSAWVGRQHPALGSAIRDMLRTLEATLDPGRDVVLISAYLMYYDVCREIARICERRRIPLIVGGSYFYQPEVAAEWTKIPGVAAIELTATGNGPSLVSGSTAGQPFPRRRCRGSTSCRFPTTAIFRGIATRTASCRW
mgnify:CR=1 FL=1